ncbi:hypothetical protein P5G62_011000 [Neobacillus sp. 179-C4.2 HS]|uniref:Uncharacterized protein n=1 Tax=Neobacillus driksii TaxID=3035913 RepID=A0ABV4YSX2_9BACI|nr:hypothetical protein [Neobacillus sp. 179.-C4.2 HS]MDP5194245.1 hypothetical protein [Neobacillus sp. 179.-C4.2 HS]
MNQSIMIEVDRTTENILNMIETKISSGSMDAMEQAKGDIIQELESNIQRIRMKIDDSLKKVLKSSEEVEGQVSKEIKQINQLIFDVQTGFKEKLSEVELHLKEQNNKTIQQHISFQDGIIQAVETIKASVEIEVKNLETIIFKSINEETIRLQETIAGLLKESLLTEKENVLKEIAFYTNQIRKENQNLHQLVMDSLKHSHLENKNKYSEIKQEYQESRNRNQQIIENVNLVTTKLQEMEVKINQTRQENQNQQKLTIETFKNYQSEIENMYTDTKQKLRESEIQNQQLVDLVNLLTKKLDHVEKEVARSNQSFYKKWFSKGSN